MSTIDQTAEQVFDSLNGFDEIAIAGAFGSTVMQLAEKDPSMFTRSLAYVVKRREGATDDDARTAALSMTLGEFESFFAEATEEEAGKGEQPGPSPETSLTSVS